MTALREQRSRRWLAGGAVGLLVGIGLSFLGSGPVGGWIATAAAVVLVMGIHTFGRLGPDLPPRSDSKEPKSQKKSRNKRKAIRRSDP
ncbi:MAG TPA: hypothetical protein PLJ27_08225 [Polyangiaceae bacterium]|nr:MAG: hypothetical protein BWY17_04799 [Deltaproteobacteria bacterium ADurb.Bin207]HNS96891.1 hypothetical protein [Polyangiaceae bacterium]HNZ24408.1 hypothetical protein [Polyangiaceae bacterium]HOD22472.1 hypothetical protein [Polyangiaceae bacterium]HOE49220.1 hypothetical protein [Polyangiaceae bacterium]